MIVLMTMKFIQNLSPSRKRDYNKETKIKKKKMDKIQRPKSIFKP